MLYQLSYPGTKSRDRDSNPELLISSEDNP